jgi:hypothetical protein
MLTSDFPFLLLCGLLLLSFGFFRHYSSLKLDFVDFLFKFMPVTKLTHMRTQFDICLYGAYMVDVVG